MITINNSLSIPRINGASNTTRPETKSKKGERTFTSENTEIAANRSSEERVILHELISVVEQISVRFGNKTNPLTKKEIEDGIVCMKAFKELKLLGTNEVLDKRVKQFSKQLLEAQVRF